MNVTIIGTGRMAHALSAKLLESGHTVSLIEHTPGKAEALVKELMSSKNGGTIEAAKPGSIPGEVVILAVPYSAVVSVIQQYNSQLAGKILIDITNPINFQSMEPFIKDGSAAEQIARLVPAPRVWRRPSIRSLPKRYRPERWLISRWMSLLRVMMLRINPKWCR